MSCDGTLAGLAVCLRPRKSELDGESPFPAERRRSRTKRANEFSSRALRQRLDDEVPEHSGPAPRVEPLTVNDEQPSDATAGALADELSERIGESTCAQTVQVERVLG